MVGGGGQNWFFSDFDDIINNGAGPGPNDRTTHVWDCPVAVYEELLMEGELTVLKQEGCCLSVSRDFPFLMARIEHDRQKAIQAQKSGEFSSVHIYFRFWGPMKIFYSDHEGKLMHRWILKERIDEFNTLVRVGKFTLQCTFADHEEVDLFFHTFSHIWSFFSNRFDSKADCWIPKDDLTLARMNASAFAEAIRGLLGKFPQSQFAWMAQSEHSPDLLGALRPRSPPRPHLRVGCSTSPAHHR